MGTNSRKAIYEYLEEKLKSWIVLSEFLHLKNTTLHNAKFHPNLTKENKLRTCNHQ